MYILYVLASFVDGFFEPEHKSAELAFKWTMQKINLRNDILSQVLVAYIVKQVTPDDSFDVSKKGRSVRLRSR